MYGATALTTVYAPDGFRVLMAISSLTTTRLAFGSDSMRVLIDRDSKKAEVAAWCHMNGCQVVTLDSGEPPRMRELLRMGFESVRTPIAWTVESDVFIDTAMASAGTRLLDRLPEKAVSLSVKTIDDRGRTCYPNNSKRIPLDTEIPEGQIAGELKHFVTWCCTAWRTEPMKRLDWDKVPVFHRSDIIAGELLLKAGYRHYGTPYLAALHYPRSSRLGTEAFPDPSRAPGEVPVIARHWLERTQDAKSELERDR